MTGDVMQQSDLRWVYGRIYLVRRSEAKESRKFSSHQGLYDCEYELASKEWIKPKSVQFFLVHNSFVRTQNPSCNTFI